MENISFYIRVLTTYRDTVSLLESWDVVLDQILKFIFSLSLSDFRKTPYGIVTRLVFS